MMGMDMMVKALGLDPEKLKSNVEEVMRDVSAMRAEHERQGRVIDAVARSLNIDPAEFSAPHEDK